MNSFASENKRNISFIIKNTDPLFRDIKIFGCKIAYNATKDLMELKGIAEDDIKASLAKGDLRNKLEKNIITIISSNLLLTQLDSIEKEFFNSKNVPFINPNSTNLVTRVIQSFGVNLITGDIVFAGGFNFTLGVDQQIMWGMSEIPNNATIVDIGIWVDPANNTLPGTSKVQLSLSSAEKNNSQNLSDVFIYEDPLTGSSYQAPHELKKTNINHKLDMSNYFYYVLLIGESGVNADAVDTYGSLFVNYFV